MNNSWIVRSFRMRARLLRRSARRLSQMVRYRRLGLAGVPVLFANSFPKSGTHLLTQVLAGFTSLGPAVDSGLPAVVTFDGETGRERSIEEILADLRRFLPGDIAYGHIHALPTAMDELCRARYATCFILRDPRDVVVSHVHYVTQMKPNHIHHAYYNQVLHTFDERLSASIAGVSEAGGYTALPDVRARFVPFFGWLTRPEVLVLRYEEFLADLPTALGRVLEHALQRGFPLLIERERAIEILAGSIDPQRSPTFRSGKAGGWRERFTPAHKELFKTVAGDLLQQLGYEQDQNW